MRSGLKSRASILVDTSIARTMSIPSVSIFSISVLERGRAMAMIIITRATVRSRKGRCLSTARGEVPPFSQGAAVLTRRCGLRSRSSIQR